MSEEFYALWYSLSDLQQKFVMKRLYLPTKAAAAEAQRGNLPAASAIRMNQTLQHGPR